MTDSSDVLESILFEFLISLSLSLSLSAKGLFKGIHGKDSSQYWQNEEKFLESPTVKKHRSCSSASCPRTPGRLFSVVQLLGWSDHLDAEVWPCPQSTGASLHSFLKQITVVIIWWCNRGVEEQTSIDVKEQTIVDVKEQTIMGVKEHNYGCQRTNNYGCQRTQLWVSKKQTIMGVKEHNYGCQRTIMGVKEQTIMGVKEQTMSVKEQTIMSVKKQIICASWGPRVPCDTNLFPHHHLSCLSLTNWLTTMSSIIESVDTIQ